jgi:hypothetical protein
MHMLACQSSHTSSPVAMFTSSVAQVCTGTKTACGGGDSQVTWASRGTALHGDRPLVIISEAPRR